jgi:hypothetical protein
VVSGFQAIGKNLPSMNSAIASLVLLMLLATVVRSEWTPPEKPNPSEVLREAQADAAAGRYDDALAKHVWYHDNALKIAPAQYGVRLSFALGYWHKLGLSYPPAMEKLRSIRDENVRAIQAGGGNREVFHDLTSINRQLGEEEGTARLFVQLDAERPEFAKLVYGLAQPALIRAREYSLAGKYLDPKRDFENAVRRLDEMRKMENGDRAQRMMQFATSKFAAEITTLVALLNQNGRKEEAQAIADQARKHWDTEEFQQKLKEALKGAVPEPWP